MKLFLMIGLLLAVLIFPKDSFATKKIVVDLSTQKLSAYDGDNLVYNFTVSTGKPWTPTPIGEFKPWVKLKSTRMKGPGYNLPNVPYVVYFHKGYGIHGTYWHSNFGHPMSHGCINVKTVEMAQLYNWIDMQTLISITGKTPA